MSSQTSEPTSADLFTPKIVTVLREGYGAREFRADAIAGLTVAIVALPLSMAIAVASGVSPDRGLYTAIIGGGLISILGGSRLQIAGPTGAFIAILAGITANTNDRVDHMLLKKAAFCHFHGESSLHAKIVLWLDKPDLALCQRQRT